LSRYGAYQSIGSILLSSCGYYLQLNLQSSFIWVKVCVLYYPLCDHHQLSMPSNNDKSLKDKEGMKRPRWTQQEVERLWQLRNDISKHLKRKIRDKELERCFNTFGDTYRSEDAIKSKMRNMKPSGLFGSGNSMAYSK